MQFLISIRDTDSNEEKRSIVYASSFYTALIKYANQLALGSLTKLIPLKRSSEND